MASTSQPDSSSNAHFNAGLSNSSDIDLNAPGNYSSANVTVLSGTSRLTVSSGVGFATGTPRTENRKGVKEGRETGVGGMPAVLGVGRTGKAPAAVPVGLVNATRKENRRKEAEKKLAMVGGERENHVYFWLATGSADEDAFVSEQGTDRAPIQTTQDGGRDRKKQEKRARSESPISDREGRCRSSATRGPPELEESPSIHTKPAETVVWTIHETYAKAVANYQYGPVYATPEQLDAQMDRHRRQAEARASSGENLQHTERNRAGSYAFVPRERLNPFLVDQRDTAAPKAKTRTYAFLPRERLNPFELGASEKVSETARPAHQAASIHKARSSEKMKADIKCFIRDIGRKQHDRQKPDETPEQASELNFPDTREYFSSSYMKKLNLPYLEEQYTLALKDHAYLLDRLTIIPADDDGRYWERHSHYSADVFKSEEELEKLAQRLMSDRLFCDDDTKNLEGSSLIEWWKRARKEMCKTQGEKLEKLAEEVWLEPIYDLNPVHYGSVPD